MTYKTHISFGLLCSSVVFLLIYEIQFSPLLILLLILSTVLGASAPDLDTPTSEIWREIPAGNIMSRIVNPVFIGGHRHLTHSILGLGLFTGLFWMLLKLAPSLQLNSYNLILAYAIGHASHILADSFTEEGVPIFFPWDYHFGIPPNPFQKVRIKTGHWFENLVVYPAINIALIMVLLNYFQIHL